MSEKVKNIGLSSAEAELRLKKYGPNISAQSSPKSLLSIIIGVLGEPMFLMLLSAGGIYLLLGDLAEALFLLVFVFVVIGITLIQAHKTERALESLRDLSAPRALVIRDGKEIRIAGQKVVPGDLLVLHEGDRIAADGRLVEGQIFVDESLLTGESIPLGKTADTDGESKTSKIFASTVITKGCATAIAELTGNDTAVGQIGKSLLTTYDTASGLQISSRIIVKNLVMIAFATVFVLVLVNWLLNQHSFLQSILSGITLAMAILPEEITVILTVFLALGAWRISKINVLTRDIAAVEALGTITVLAADKTGTLTQNSMQVAELSVDDASFISSSQKKLEEKFHSLVEFAMLATPANPFDPMEKAIHSFGRELLSGTEHIHDNSIPDFEYELCAEILAMTRVLSTSDPSLYMLATKGAPEAVADLCHLPKDELEDIEQRVEAMAQRGLRVLGVARGEWRKKDQDQNWPKSQHDFDFTFLGLIGFIDPLREEVPKAVKTCQDAGIKVLMLTGDHPMTAGAIAAQAGLSKDSGIILGDEIETLDDDTLKERLKETAICARMRPEHKLRLVQVLQDSGEIVAMTGDGVNDAPALKASNVGIAMGQRGTDVARESASLVLLDDSFASITDAVAQGRRIYDNITKATRFAFAVHLPIIMLTLLPALLQWPILLMPAHIVLLQLLIDPACSIVFESEPAAADIMKRPPRRIGESPFSIKNVKHALMQGGGIAFILMAGDALLQQMQWNDAAIRMSIFISFVLTLFFLILANRTLTYTVKSYAREHNPWMIFMFGGVALILASIIFIPALREIMRFSPIEASILLAALFLFLSNGAWLFLLHFSNSLGLKNTKGD
ncbi:cation-translocating P-type ATPase [Sulfurimonas sp. HSL-1716]|uniref:cation-translocating P-type ATPase n=1 Tax=Hydrocurvibacter sulfurireducens TaxID=3131937 RepID=UPI0031F79614